MNTMQKKAYRYEYLGQVIEGIDRQITGEKISIEEYLEQQKESPNNTWYQECIDEYNAKIEVLAALKKEIEKL